ncbi:MAG: phosphatidylinositol-specific phospholipase C/glycerophosphodiester phosphodiesterase family protein [Pirellulales bacterium]|nr:phosphatidylinositol-specific phospholipase C/glycerophosphodiester phosphodiesterase family protein [Pirellulales bacterium]
MLHLLCLVVGWSWIGVMGWAQVESPAQIVQKVKPLCHAHAHNDYLQARPLLDALDRGFCSIEADIHLAGDSLLVGHDRWNLHPERTFQGLYLDPLRKRVQANGGWVYPDTKIPILLLIDIKTDGGATYQRLREVLGRYDILFSNTEIHGQSNPPVVAILSGNRPLKEVEQDPKRRVGIDGRIGDLDSKIHPHLMPLISDAWSAHFTWRGHGAMPENEQARLREMVKKAHERNRRIRFWGTPEKEAVWRELRDAGVDLIGSDNLDRLQQFLLQPGAAPFGRGIFPNE